MFRKFTEDHKDVSNCRNEAAPGRDNVMRVNAIFEQDFVKVDEEAQWYV
jgi:hypothetical protein